MGQASESSAPDPLVAIGDAREWTDLEPYREFVRLGSAGVPVALVTVLGTKGSAPRSMGAAMLVRHDGGIVGSIGGGNLEEEMIQHAREAIEDGRPRRYHFDFTGGTGQNVEKACIGTTDFLIQPCVAKPHLIIFGAGHIGRALAPVAAGAGFRVSVADDRPGFPNPEAFGDGVRLLSGPFPETIRRLTFDDTTYVVVVTYGHEQDEAVLKACLPAKWRYLGMIGSRKKVATIFKNLSSDEETAQRLSCVHAPIGLRLGGRSPGEIAVAIVAELIAVRHGRDQAGHASEGRSEPSPAESARPRSEEDPAR
jgi:xanthine dehydrogenase accessory factor